MKVESILERRRSNCFHDGKLLLDETLATVKCEKCGEALNPIFALKKVMMSQKAQAHRQVELQLHAEAASKKTRTKCQHCQKMTRIITHVPLHAVYSRLGEE